MRGFTFLTSVAVASLAIVGTAHAQHRSEGPATRVGAHALFGLGGEADFDLEGSAIFDDEADLLTTFGFGLVAEHAVHDYVLVGGRFEAAWWNTEDWDDADIDRSTVLDFSGQVKVRYPLPVESVSAEVSFTVPIGLAVSLPNDDVPGDPDTGLGFNVALLGGFALMLESNFGFYGELGWHWHSFTHELDVGGNDVDVSTGQFVMHIGVLLGL